MLTKAGDHREARRRLESAQELFETLLETQPERAELREGLEKTRDLLAGLAASSSSGGAP